MTGAAQQREFRCDHGFLGSHVKCPEGCHGPVLAREKAIAKEGTSGSHPTFSNLKGKTIAGARVIDRAQNVDGNAQWDCVLVCGHRRIVSGIQLRKTEKANRQLRCTHCRENDPLLNQTIGGFKVIARCPGTAKSPDCLIECMVCGDRRRLGVHRMREAKRNGEKLRCFTCVPLYRKGRPCANET